MSVTLLHGNGDDAEVAFHISDGHDGIIESEGVLLSILNCSDNKIREQYNDEVFLVEMPNEAYAVLDRSSIGSHTTYLYMRLDRATSTYGKCVEDCLEAFTPTQSSERSE